MQMNRSRYRRLYVFMFFIGFTYVLFSAALEDYTGGFESETAKIFKSHDKVKSYARTLEDTVKGAYVEIFEVEAEWFCLNQ